MDNLFDIGFFIVAIYLGAVALGMGLYHYRRCKAVIAEGKLYKATIAKIAPPLTRADVYAMFNLEIDGKQVKATSCTFYPKMSEPKSSYDVYYSERYPNYAVTATNGFRFYKFLIPLGCTIFGGAALFLIFVIL